MSMAFGLAFVCTLAWAQDRTVSGTISSGEDGQVLIGVNVILKGTTTGTISDIDGNYSLSVPSDGGTLVYSFIGFATQEMPIGASSVIDLTLMADVTQLGEIVVTALGIEREERSLGYAVQKIDGEEGNTVRTDSWLNNLSGRAAGVHVKNNNNFGGSINVIIRGSSSLTGNNQALFVVDGVPIGNSNPNVNDNHHNSGQRSGRGGYDYGNAANDIEPNDIESINILKGAAATALYGSRAANGVIMITTKKGKKTGRGVGVSINSNTTFGVVDKSTIPTYQTEYGAGYGPYGSHGTYPYP
jgi:TonB-dependent SusC/RagA subfamily outer membrane receptor